MNSLFYNVNEDVIEDFTKNGREDLMKGIIRTPKDTFESFIEDPLRILRAARFASTFNFILDDDLILISQKDEIKEALKLKVSRERIGVEIEKMLMGQDPVGGFSLIHEMGIRDVVFCIGYHENGELKYKPLKFDGIWSYSLYRMRKLVQLKQNDVSSFMTAFLSPLLENTSFKNLKKKESEEMKIFIEQILIDGFKWTSKLAAQVHLIYINSLEIHSLLDFDFTDEKSDQYQQNLIKLGHWIRNIKEFWEPCIYISSFLKSKENQEKKTDLVNWIKKNNFEKVIIMKPLLNGNDISKIINQKGKMIGEWCVKLMDWQILEYANKIDENIAKKWIESQIKK